MGESWMGQRRCDRLPPGLLSKSGPARAGNLLANSRGCGVLARARCARVVSISGRNETKGGPRRYLSGVGADHGTLRPGESEKILCGVVCFVVSTEHVLAASWARITSKGRPGRRQRTNPNDTLMEL